MTVDPSSTCIDDPSYHILCLATDEGTPGPSGLSCFGDSGGYAGIEDGDSERSVQYGITSFGTVDLFGGGCQEPSGYTDVAYYSDWIRQQIVEN